VNALDWKIKGRVQISRGEKRKSKLSTLDTKEEERKDRRLILQTGRPAEAFKRVEKRGRRRDLELRETLVWHSEEKSKKKRPKKGEISNLLLQPKGRERVP